MDERANIILFLGSGLLTIFWQIITYLGIPTPEVYALLAIFTFSGFAGLLKTIIFKESLKGFICFDIVSKGLSLFIPFIVAFAAKSIPPLSFFVDYCFSFLILGEIFTFLIYIQCIKTRNKDINHIDIYNLGLSNLKAFIIKYLKVNDKKGD
ncbi:hypothetical protein [Helicobacter mesocricetorum]|uniref:hypothetical protein n=1 Tax=Helicobacter mesocricetorum TaxID=87012 RepID=UPI0013153CD8|nr:hypothetical protein [Helicobacter mesocricetorum]